MCVHLQNLKSVSPLSSIKVSCSLPSFCSYLIECVICLWEFSLHVKCWTRDFISVTVSLSPSSGLGSPLYSESRPPSPLSPCWTMSAAAACDVLEIKRDRERAVATHVRQPTSMSALYCGRRFIQIECGNRSADERKAGESCIHPDQTCDSPRHLPACRR